MSGGKKPDLPEWPIAEAHPQTFNWCQNMEDRMKKLEGRVAVLEREIRGPKEGAKGGGESMSNVDQVLRECISSNVIYTCPWKGEYVKLEGDKIVPYDPANPGELYEIYCIPTGDSSFLGKLSNKLKGVGNIDDVAVKTSDGSVVCYIDVDGTLLKALREVGVLEDMKENLKQQYAECCMYHIRH
jgi:hypothetical protein